MNVLKISAGLLPEIKKKMFWVRKLDIKSEENYIGCSKCEKYVHSDCKEVDVSKILIDGEWVCSKECQTKKR